MTEILRLKNIVILKYDYSFELSILINVFKYFENKKFTFMFHNITIFKQINSSLMSMK